ncbi:MAG: hypothetical protein AB8G22_09590 [Saprospiraceae bacterium]
MELKKIIITTNAALQTLLLVGFIGGLFLADYMGEPDLEWIPVVSFFGFAAVQLLGMLLNDLFYQFPQARKYIKVFIYVQVVGTLTACLLGMTEIDFLSGIAGFLLFFIWIVAPFFQAIWCFILSWVFVFEEEKIEEYV